MVMIPLNESSGRALLRGSLEQALPQPDSPVSQAVPRPAPPHRIQCGLAQQLIQADLLLPLSNACLLYPEMPSFFCSAPRCRPFSPAWDLSLPWTLVEVLAPFGDNHRSLDLTSLASCFWFS